MLKNITYWQYIFTIVLINFFLAMAVLHRPASALEYKFPWAADAEWSWWTRSGNVWHDCQCALDFGTSTNIELLSPADGQIASKCVGPNTVNFKILHDDGKTMWYAHLDKYQVPTGLVPGVRVTQGQLLGKLMLGNINETVSSCPEPHKTAAYQQSYAGHVHWQVPKNTTLVIDGWQINYLSNYMEKDGQRIYAGGQLRSTNKLIMSDHYITNPVNYSTPNSFTFRPPFSANGNNGAITFKIY